MRTDVILYSMFLEGAGEQLRDVLSIRHLFDNIKIVLILPDRKNETIVIGHKLRPRFLSYTDGDFKDIAAVLKKMLTVLNFSNEKLKEVN